VWMTGGIDLNLDDLDGIDYLDDLDGIDYLDDLDGIDLNLDDLGGCGVDKLGEPMECSTDDDEFVWNIDLTLEDLGIPDPVILNETIRNMELKSDLEKHREALDKSKVQIKDFKTIRQINEGLNSSEMCMRGQSLIETLRTDVVLRYKIMSTLKDDPQLALGYKLYIDKLQKTIEEINQTIIDLNHHLGDCSNLSATEEEIERKKKEMLQYWDDKIEQLPPFKVGEFEDTLREKLRDRFNEILSSGLSDELLLGELNQKETIFDEVYYSVLNDYDDPDM